MCVRASRVSTLLATPRAPPSSNSPFPSGFRGDTEPDCPNSPLYKCGLSVVTDGGREEGKVERGTREWVRG